MQAFPLHVPPSSTHVVSAQGPISCTPGTLRHTSQDSGGVSLEDKEYLSQMLRLPLSSDGGGAGGGAGGGVGGGAGGGGGGGGVSRHEGNLCESAGNCSHIELIFVLAAVTPTEKVSSKATKMRRMATVPNAVAVVFMNSDFTLLPSKVQSTRSNGVIIASFDATIR